MTTYHERVARKMKASYSAGSMNSYDTILAALHRKYPREQDLRAMIAHLESHARRFEPGFVFLEDEH